IETHNTKYFGRKTEGNYPQVDRLIPDSFNNVFTIHDVEYFTNIIGQIVKLTKTDRNNVMQIKILDNSTMEIKATCEGDSIETTIDINADYVQNDFTMSFSSKYLLEGIKQLNKPISLTFSIT